MARVKLENFGAKEIHLPRFVLNHFKMPFKCEWYQCLSEWIIPMPDIPLLNNKQQLKLLILVLQLIKSMGNVTDGQLSIFMIFLKVNFHRNHPSPVKRSGVTCPILTPFDQLWPRMTFEWSNTGKILANFEYSVSSVGLLHSNDLRKNSCGLEVTFEWPWMIYFDKKIP